MGYRAVNTGKFMPGGLVAALSTVLVFLYVGVLVNPPPKSKAT